MRLLTRSDFDGLACGTILKHLGIIDSWKFVHPKDVQDGIVEVTKDDVLANIPYVEGCALWFDHHSSEEERLGNSIIQFEGESRRADSAARVVFEYYNGKERAPEFEEMLRAVDKVDAAKLSIDDIDNPSGWVLLGFIMDPRTGLGRFRNFRISNYDLMEKLIDACANSSIDEILADPDVRERVDLYFVQNDLFKRMVKEQTRVDGNVIITDLRGIETIYSGNRFIVYTLCPEQNISLWVTDGREQKNCAIAIGHSITNRTSKTNVGKLALKFGGGGHNQVGTCQVPYDQADAAIAEIVAKAKADG
ncbi:MAG: exopolyphosphatase [Oscillospiraceae bacterium]|nr:exopolyphosphatase [Oscillospiraceae bacterium]